jgi:prepilin-type processing-associated H-X9-DG protein
LLALPAACGIRPANFTTAGYGNYSSMTLIPFARTPNSTTIRCLAVMGDASNSWGMLDGPSSLHPGGVNVAFADGSVKFFTDRVNPATWKALATTEGGEAISASSF